MKRSGYERLRAIAAKRKAINLVGRELVADVLGEMDTAAREIERLESELAAARRYHDAVEGALA